MYNAIASIVTAIVNVMRICLFFLLEVLTKVLLLIINSTEADIKLVEPTGKLK